MPPDRTVRGHSCAQCFFSGVSQCWWQEAQLPPQPSPFQPPCREIHTTASANRTASTSNADAVRGLEDFSHIWLVWQFSGAVRDSWSPTVRPPRLGGNTRMGVFATRSPFRPNPLGLSSVQLEAIEHRPDVGPVLIVRGADLMDGTPIYDIKPYIPYADCHPDAAGGFTAQTQFHHLTMVCDAGLWARVPADQQAALQGVLENDPRPSYQHDPERVYGMEFGGLEVHFKVDGEVLTVTGIDRR